MPPVWVIDTSSVKDAVQAIVRSLEDTSNAAHNSFYFDGWNQLGASAVLRAIAENPPPSLRKKFDKIIHIDCSRWKSRRVLQRAIAAKLKLSPQVMAAFDKQDEEDDYSGVDEGSRAEIEDVTREIYQTISNLSCLVILHNGSDSTVDIADFGFPQYRFSPKINKLLWTFRGRLRLSGMKIRDLANSHVLIEPALIYGSTRMLLIRELLLEEAKEVVKHVQHKQRVSPRTAARCFSYLLSLAGESGNIMVHKWGSQASNYWVCDGIIEEGEEVQFDESWEVSAALQQNIQIDDSSSYKGFVFLRDTLRWKSVTYEPWMRRHKANVDINVDTELTSFFLDSTGTDPLDMFQLPSDMFQKSDRLRVLKLSRCKFSFFSPPFHCCRSLRFLGLDSCHDVTTEEERKKGSPALEFFGGLWVLDISRIDWDLELPQNIMDQMAVNTKDVHVEEGRIWHSKFAWGRLQNLRKLRVINATRSWETGNKDEFTDMVKLELLDLSGNSTIQILPSLSTATALKTLVLDGCVELDHVGPEGLPPSLESFSLNADSGKLSKIFLVGCAHLKSFLLRGTLPGLEELNLSGTSVKKIDLSHVHVPHLKRIFMIGCKQLHAIDWGREWGMRLEVLCIDTHGRTKGRVSLSDSSSICIQNKNYVAYVSATDVRIVQSLLRYDTYLLHPIPYSLFLDLHVTPPSSSRSKGSSSDKKVILKRGCYRDVFLEGVAAYDDGITWPLPFDRHIEIGEGIKLTDDVMGDKGIKAFSYMMGQYFDSLHVHDSSSIGFGPLRFSNGLSSTLRWCRVERCPKLQVMFGPYHFRACQMFEYLKTIWASDLPAVACIWSKGIILQWSSNNFKALQSIYLHNCPRLKFVLPFSGFTLPRLETLHISHCGDLRQVFPWDTDAAKEYSKEGTAKKFPMLKHIHLHELASLLEICEAKMYAPMLESVRIRGCWALRRLPAVGHLGSHGPVVDCEKDWWQKLKWDGLDAGHHPSLYQPQHSSYYKKRLLRGTVLR